MSYGGQPRNPDTRELPRGWIEQYDANYGSWFYVNANENPPRASWVHPLGPPHSSRPGGYVPPPGPPPPDRRSVSPYAPSGYNQPPYGQGPPPPQRYDNYSPQYGGPSPGPGAVSPYGGPPPRGDQQRGWLSGGRPPMGSSMPPPVEMVQAPHKKHHGGVGTALAVGGAGLLGGFLLTEGVEAWDNHERREGFEAGEQMGFNQGEQVGFDRGEQVGFNQGDQVGFDQGERVGFDRGDDIGFERGEQAGFNQGFDDGFDADNGW